MPRRVRLHDTRSGEIRPVEPRVPGKLGIYVCGPTVYGRIHVGNARPYVVFLLLKRFLEHEGYATKLIINITDINDKIYAAADLLEEGSEQLAREMTAAYVADTDRLALGRPDHEPLASESIARIIELIEELIEGGHAYEVGGDVYFNVRGYPQYGEISHRKVDDMDQGEGVEGAELKRDPVDFALWKAHKPREDSAWDSPWGRGRPGWHIECSAMAESLLGVDFEIHGGGSDLVFPHHENEAAQTRAARGVELARMWVHNGMIRIDEAKMAKSIGNVFLLHEALDAYGRDALIMFFVSGHYRQPVEFDAERMAEAKAAVGRIREAARRLRGGPSPAWSSVLRERFFSALADDFGTPAALAVVFEWVREANRAAEGVGAGSAEGVGGRSAEPVGDADLREMLQVLGLDGLLTVDAIRAPDGVRELLGARERARGARDYAEADRLRDEIRALGWEVRDGAEGPELLPVG